MSAPTRVMHAIVVRMMSDARFRAAVYRDPDAALADTPLSAEERAWFVQPDRRAFAIDPLRNARLLTALLDEFPVAAHALARAGWRVPRFHHFFESHYFHRAIDTWSSLFYAFPDWLVSRSADDATARAMVIVEGAIARVRRGAHVTTRPAPGELMLSPEVAPAVVPAGAVALWQRHDAALRSAPGGASAVIAAAIADGRGLDGRHGAPSLTGGLDGDGETEALLVTLDAGAPQIALVGEGLAVVLAAALRPIAKERFVKAGIDEGLDESEAVELIDELVLDGTLLSGG